MKIFCNGKVSYIFSNKKQQHICDNNSIFVIIILFTFKKFNETLTNDVFNIEQPAPGCIYIHHITKTCPCNIQQFFTAVKMKIFR